MNSSPADTDKQTLTRKRTDFPTAWRTGSAKPRQLQRWLLAPLLAASRLPALERLYGNLPPVGQPADFFGSALAALGVRYAVTPETLTRIPRLGPVILVANHPFGAVDGLILGDILRQVRPDFKFLANSLLAGIPELQPHVIAVDPFGGRTAVRQNIRPLKETLAWLRDGGALAVFPAGEVAHWHLRHREVVDPHWHPNVAGLLRHSGATAVPVYFAGRNSVAFQMAGLMHPRLRTALLPRELLNKRKQTIRVEIGERVPAERIAALPSDTAILQHLRFRTYMLRDRQTNQPGEPRRASPPSAVAVPPSCSPRADTLLPPLVPASTRPAHEDVEALPSDQRLHESGDLEVWYAPAWQLPRLLPEIGRLREVTFRQVGEGTGKALDLDRFDRDYLHLFAWNREKRELVGAYRLGQTDVILPRWGTWGLYTHTLFRFRPETIASLGPALELGRSFIRSEYQRSFGALLGLWKGIGQFVVRHPQYRFLFGPVSIPAEYLPVSRQLLAAYLDAHHSLPQLAAAIRPRQPLRRRSWGGVAPNDFAHGVQSIEEMSELIAGIESDAKGVPILVRQYLKLGGRLLGFNVDPKFSNVLDGLILVDLMRTDAQALDKYLGKAGAASFRAHHNQLLINNSGN